MSRLFIKNKKLLLAIEKINKRHAIEKKLLKNTIHVNFSKRFKLLFAASQTPHTAAYSSIQQHSKRFYKLLK